MTPERTVRHTPDSIVAVAMELLDELGIADLSMRRLAAGLDVQPSALYWHFANKQSLLAAVADRIVASADLAGATSLRDTATRLRAALLAHRDGAEVVLSTAALALGSDEARAALRRHLGDDDDADAHADALFHFVLGGATLVQQRLHAQRFGVVHDDPRRIRDESDRAFAAGLAALTR